MDARQKQALRGAAIFVLVAIIGSYAATWSPSYEQCKTDNSNDASNDKQSNFYKGVRILIICEGDFTNKNGSAITALATIVMAIFAGTLWRATSKQGDFAERALVSNRRAFVFPINIYNEWYFDKATGHYDWRIRPVWTNSGETVTKNMTLYVDAELRNSPIPPMHVFVEKTAPGSGMLGPKSTNYGGAAPTPPSAAITPQDILDIQNSKKFLYLWGWAKYHDVFEGTPQHVTKFCWQILSHGDPFAYVPGQASGAPNALTFGYVHNTDGNCADDECSG